MLEGELEIWGSAFKGLGDGSPSMGSSSSSSSSSSSNSSFIFTADNP